MFVFTVENISNIKNLTYSKDGMSDKLLKVIDYSKTDGMFKDFNYSKYSIQTPPKNTSITTYEELKFLNNLPKDEEFVKKYDNIEAVFKEICVEHNLNYPDELVNDILKSSGGIILDLKNKFNRPRPFQLAKHYNINLGGITLDSMKTPSYPSGHSAQGILIGKILQTKLPITTDAFLEAGRRISFSRNMGRAHFPSDSRLGEELGTSMYEYLKNKI